MSQHTFEVTTDNFKQQVLESTTPVLVDFTAEWCPPCKMLAPIVDEIARKYEGKLTVGTLDNDAYPEFQEMFDVYGLPTLILFQNGVPVQRIVGFKPRERIEDVITPYFATIVE